jgi:hypothetical protein
MSVWKRRSRHVSFRLSEDEYRRFCDYCAGAGARSISDMARSAVCKLAGLVEDEDAGSIATRMRSLDLRVRQLDRKLEQLTTLLKSSGAPSEHGAAGRRQ